MRAVYTTRARPAKNWEQRMQIAPTRLRQAVGKNTALVAQARKRIMDATIYHRPPTDRPLTGRLKRSETVAMSGTVARIRNTAPYAQKRNDATGISKSYPHDMTSNWAGRAVQETARERSKNVRAAMREIMGTKAE